MAAPVGQYARWAKEGDIDSLLGLATYDGRDDGDGLALKWLLAAVDFGHAQADEAIDDLLEASSLRFDDDQFTQGSAHWELGLAYLSAAEGLPRDLVCAKRHLLAALQAHCPMSIHGAGALEQARQGLDPEALALFNSIYP